MKSILIIGLGNIGTFMGAALQASGNEVMHYVRNPEKAKKEVILDFNDRRKTQKIKKGSVYSYSMLTASDQIKSFEFIIIPVAHYTLSYKKQS